jgi:hypothetical protein
LLPASTLVGCATTSNPAPDTNGVTVHSNETTVSKGSGERGMTVVTNDVNGGSQIHVSGTPMAAMSALAQIYSDLKIPIGTMATSTGQIGNSNYTVPSHEIGGNALSRYLNCGLDPTSTPRADAGVVTISVMSTAVAIGDTASVVTTTVSGSARPINDSSNRVTCQTTGGLERRINTRLAVAMAKSP